MSKATPAFLQGQTAFDRLKGISQNPYQQNTVQNKDWANGYKFQQAIMRNK
jgi:hypothetical protein